MPIHPDCPGLCARGQMGGMLWGASWNRINNTDPPCEHSSGLIGRIAWSVKDELPERKKHAVSGMESSSREPDATARGRV
jgi:hypothetical protein